MASSCQLLSDVFLPAADAVPAQRECPIPATSEITERRAPAVEQLFATFRSRGQAGQGGSNGAQPGGLDATLEVAAEAGEQELEQQVEGAEDDGPAKENAEEDQENQDAGTGLPGAIAAHSGRQPGQAAPHSSGAVGSGKEAGAVLPRPRTRIPTARPPLPPSKKQRLSSDN